jgi:hypothetical protein
VFLGTLPSFLLFVKAFVFSNSHATKPPHDHSGVVFRLHAAIGNEVVDQQDTDVEQAEKDDECLPKGIPLSQQE